MSFSRKKGLFCGNLWNEIAGKTVQNRYAKTAFLPGFIKSLSQWQRSSMHFHTLLCIKLKISIKTVQNSQKSIQK